MTRQCGICRYWRPIEKDGGPLQPGQCTAIKVQPFWLHHHHTPPTFASEGIFCSAWKERKKSCATPSS